MEAEVLSTKIKRKKKQMFLDAVAFISFVTKQHNKTKFKYRVMTKPKKTKNLTGNNYSYYIYQRFQHMNEANGAFCIVLTH